MSLRSGLIGMLWLVTLLTGLATLGWTAAEAYRAAGHDMRTTLARAGMVLERNYHMEPRAGDPHYAEWTSIKLLGVMAPGTCIEFQQGTISPRRLCAGWQVFGPIPPEAYRALSKRIFTVPRPITREGSASQNGTFTITASFDPLAVTTLSWQRVCLAVCQTLAMAAGVLALGTLAVVWRLGPVARIVRGLDHLAAGELGKQIEPGGAKEFRQIASALNQLSGKLRVGAERQRTLTRRLLEVEDTERRQLARDLHDEFGQTLTATSALAASIAIAAADRPDVVGDARSIGTNIRSMMECLRGAFARLRPPELEEVGLFGSLRTMLAGWEQERGVKMELTIDVPEDRVPDEVALDLYRIVQECVTNAIRHGTPAAVSVRLSGEQGALVLIVQDDGGGLSGEPRRGHGILGIRERIEAQSGALDIRDTGRGVRVAVSIPVPAQADAA